MRRPCLGLGTEPGCCVRVDFRGFVSRSVHGSFKYSIRRNSPDEIYAATFDDDFDSLLWQPTDLTVSPDPECILTLEIGYWGDEDFTVLATATSTLAELQSAGYVSDGGVSLQTQNPWAPDFVAAVAVPEPATCALALLDMRVVSPDGSVSPRKPDANKPALVNGRGFAEAAISVSKGSIRAFSAKAAASAEPEASEAASSVVAATAAPAPAAETDGTTAEIELIAPETSPDSGFFRVLRN